MAGLYARRYARHFEALREQGRRLASDTAAQERSRRYVKRFAAACNQTGGNVKQATALVEQWEEAEERARNSPVRTLAMSESGDPCEHEEDA